MPRGVAPGVEGSPTAVFQLRSNWRTDRSRRPGFRQPKDPLSPINAMATYELVL